MAKKCVCLAEIALGLARVSQKEVVAAVDSLVKKGTLSKERSVKFLHHLQAEGTDCKNAIEKQIQGSAKKALGDLGFVTADDVALLRKEIKALKALPKSVSSANA